MLNTHKATLEKANKAVVAGDYEGFLTFCTENTEWTTVGEQTLRGKEAVRQWMSSTYLAPPRLEVHRMIAGDEFLTAMGRVAVKDANGNYGESWYCDVWRWRG